MKSNQNLSFLWSLGAIQRFSVAKDQVLNNLLSFGLLEDKKTKAKPGLALSQTPYSVNNDGLS